MGDTLPADKPLTDRLLRSWIRCRRRAWLDRHGPVLERRYTAHRTLQLDDQQRCFVALLPQKPAAGQAGLAAGAAGVVGVRLYGTGPDGLSIQAHPALLQRVKGRSRWGEFAYRPVMARQGRRLTREHRLPLALAGRLLNDHQQGAVPAALAVGLEGGHRLAKERLPLNAALDRQLDEALGKLASDLRRPQPPALAADRRKCTLCSWRGLCNAQAVADGHLSEVSGIGAKRRDMLQDLGIDSLQDLASADPDALASQLGRFGEQHAAVASPLVAQALAQFEGRCNVLDGSPALPELDRAPGVLLYDIESDPDARDDFLHGFVVMPRSADGAWDLALARYHPVLTLQDQGEHRCWRRLSTLLARYSDWPVLHYGETESLALRRMAQRQNASAAQRDALQHRLVDVHARVRRHWRLPLNSYGLKSVAAWRGFQWRQRHVDGARALLWWRQWRGMGPGGRGHPQTLRWIFTYNEDDCLATWSVAAWLLSASQESGQSSNEAGELISS